MGQAMIAVRRGRMSRSFARRIANRHGRDSDRIRIVNRKNVAVKK